MNDIKNLYIYDFAVSEDGKGTITEETLGIEKITENFIITAQKCSVNAFLGRTRFDKSAIDTLDEKADRAFFSKPSLDEFRNLVKERYDGKIKAAQTAIKQLEKADIARINTDLTCKDKTKDAE